MQVSDDLAGRAAPPAGGAAPALRRADAVLAALLAWAASLLVVAEIAVLFAGVLRYRLFDIDRILSRVLVYGLLILGSGLVYLAAVVTGAALVGGADWWTVFVLAAAAVALQPAWSFAQRWANRVVFGSDLDIALQRVLGVARGLLDSVAGAGAAGQVREEHAVSVWATFDDGGIVGDGHDQLPSLTPDWRSMLLRVPTGRSLRGCGTVTVPGFIGWRK